MPSTFRPTEHADCVTDDDRRINQKECLRQTALKFFLMNKRPVLQPCVLTPIALCHIASHYEFYAIKVDEVRWLNAVQHHLQAFYGAHAEPMLALEVDFVCAVLDESTWYRGIVKQIDEADGIKRVHVSLMDFGRVVCTQQAHLAVLSDRFSGCRAFAFKCRLVVLNSDSREVARNEELVHELRARLQVFVDQQTHGLVYWNVATAPDKLQFYKIVLFIDAIDGPDNLFDGAYTLHETFAAFNRSKVQFSDPVCRAWANRPIERYNFDEMRFGERFWVAPSHIASPSAIYLRTSNDMHALVVNVWPQIDRYISEHVHRMRTEREWAVGDLCLVRTQNPGTKTKMEMWFRGRITAIADGVIEVFLRDTGTLTTVAAEHLLSAPAHLANGRDMAMKCYFVQCKGLQSNDLVDIVHDSIYACHLYEACIVERDGAAFGISLRGVKSLPRKGQPNSWCDIGCQVLSRATVASMRQFVETTQKAYYQQKAGKNIAKYADPLFAGSLLSGPHSSNMRMITKRQPCPDAMDVVVAWLPPARTESLKFTGTIVWLDTRGVFFIQTDGQADACRSLGNAIDAHVRENASMLRQISHRHEWQVGDACLAFYRLDRRFYRAVVVLIDKYRCNATVRFVDYGQCCRCHLDILRLDTEFGPIPTLVNRFSIPEIVPVRPRTGWNRNIWKDCSDWCMNRKCCVEVNRVEDTALSVVPCSITLADDVNVLDWIEQNGKSFASSIGLNDEIIFKV